MHRQATAAWSPTGDAAAADRSMAYVMSRRCAAVIDRPRMSGARAGEVFDMTRITVIVAFAIAFLLSTAGPALADTSPGQQGYEGQPGNQGNGLLGYEGQPGNQGGH